MTRAVMLAALALSLAAPVAAQDNRLQTLVFNENAVVRIDGKVKVQTTIKFAPDEVIENVAIGDSMAWQVQPNKAQTILFVKPLELDARTNMTVVTDKRTYLFDLVASPKNAALYVLQFRYPELEKAAEEVRDADEILNGPMAPGPNLASLMRRLQKAPRVLVSASAVGFYGASPNASMEPLDETAPPRPGEFQSDLCAAIEHEARRAEALGVRVVRIRFGVVLGHGGGAYPMQALSARLGLGAGRAAARPGCSAGRRPGPATTPPAGKPCAGTSAPDCR